MDNFYEYGVPKKKGHKGLVVGIIVFVVALLVIGGIFYYKLVYSKNSFQVLLNYAFDYLETSIEESDQDSLTGTFSMDLEFHSTDPEDAEVVAIFNKLDLAGTYGIDYDRNVMSVDFYSNYDEKDLLDFSVYTEYGKAYVYLSGLYDKYIETSVDDYTGLFEKKYDDYKIVISSVKDALMESLKEDYFEVERVTLDSEKVTKTTLNLNKENSQEMMDNFIGMLLENEKFLNSLSNVTDTEVSELKTSLEEELAEEVEGDSKIILYTKGIQFVQFEEVSDDYYFVVKEDDGTYSYECYENDELSLDGKVKVTKKDDEVTVVFSYDDKEEGMGFGITVRESMKKNGKVETKDVSNSISSEKLTDDDIAAIYSKLLENEGIVKIIDEISKLSGEGTDDSSLETMPGV